MKKYLIIALGLLCFGSLSAQNVQLHYDLGSDRQMFTSTIEMFKADKWGSTFFFSDLDYGSKASNIDGISLAYLEIARSFQLGEHIGIQPRVEYNGGFGRGLGVKNDNSTQYHFSINSAWLAGVEHTFHTSDFSKLLTLQANYKYIKDRHDASFQLTAVWGLHFFDRKLSVTGFADFWREEKVWGNESTKFVFLTEPQFWYNFNEHLSLGGEIEIGSNFSDGKGLIINPTIAAKWNF